MAVKRKRRESERSERLEESLSHSKAVGASLVAHRGRDYARAKGKKKRGKYASGSIDLSVNSFKFTD